MSIPFKNKNNLKTLKTSVGYSKNIKEINMSKNVKSQIIDKLNAIVQGDQTNSSIRFETLILVDDAVKNNLFKLEVDLNRADAEKKTYKKNMVSIHSLNIFGNSELKYIRDRFQYEFLGVQWKSGDKEEKAKIDAMRDVLNAYIPINAWGNDTLIKKNNSYLTGANNSKVRIKGDFVNEYCKPLNKDDIDPALNFSELQRVARGYYKEKNQAGGGTKTTPFDQAIKRASKLLDDDANAENPFEMSSSKTETNVSILITTAQNYISALRKARLEASPKHKVEMELQKAKQKKAS
jgi:hypothetical protein